MTAGLRKDTALEALPRRPPGFNPKACNVCGRRLLDHKVGEFCRRPDTPITPSAPARDHAPVRSKEFHIMSKTATWVDQAAKDLGIKGERQCRTCGGKGTIDKKPSKADVGRAIWGRQVADKAIVRALADPPLSRLQSIADALGGVSLDDAAAWCAQLSKRIEAEG